MRLAADETLLLSPFPHWTSYDNCEELKRCLRKALVGIETQNFATNHTLEARNIMKVLIIGAAGKFKCELDQACFILIVNSRLCRLSRARRLPQQEQYRYRFPKEPLEITP